MWKSAPGQFGIGFNMSDFENDSLEPIDIDKKLQKLPLVIGGDGVMVPFRPHTGSPKGKTAWREVKAGIFAGQVNVLLKKAKLFQFCFIDIWWLFWVILTISNPECRLRQSNRVS